MKTSSCLHEADDTEHRCIAEVIFEQIGINRTDQHHIHHKDQRSGKNPDERLVLD